MADRDTSRMVMAEWRALLALACLVALPCALASFLNAWSVFSFPLGTFLVALGIPLGLIIIATVWTRTVPFDPEDPDGGSD